jgi:hypothetical protein
MSRFQLAHSRLLHDNNENGFKICTVTPISRQGMLKIIPTACASTCETVGLHMPYTWADQCVLSGAFQTCVVGQRTISCWCVLYVTYNGDYSPG